MAEPAPEALTVSAPATSANLGPGFDCLAVALDLGNAVVITRRPGPLDVTVTGEGAGELPEDASNLVCRALATGLGSLEGLHVECRNRIPLGRGLGSSAAAVCSGLVAANALGGLRWTPDDLLARAAQIEGHADNAAACLTGGMVAVAPGPVARPIPVPDGLAFLAVIPQGRVSTDAARRSLPASVPLADVAATLANAVGLTLALCQGRLDDLPPLLADHVHEPHRGPSGQRPRGRARRGRRRGLPGRHHLGIGPGGAALGAVRGLRARGGRGRAGAARRRGHRHGAPVAPERGRRARPLDRRGRPAPRARGGVSAAAARWEHARGALDCARGRLVGIVNANPDSFSDGGRSAGTERAVAHGRLLAAQGADVVEVGGESLRFSDHTPVAVEIARVVPVIEQLAAELSVPVAIDTFKPEVAEAAIAAGAAILNDPTGLVAPGMAEVAAAGRVGVVLTHFLGPPKVRPRSFPDIDVAAAVRTWAEEALAGADRAGIPRERIVIDPGVGLGKSPAQDLQLLHRIDEVVSLGRPVFVPISNKKVLGALTGRAAPDRLAGTAAGLVWCRARGATIFRVHDVGFMADALTVADALVTGRAARWFDVVK